MNEIIIERGRTKVVTVSIGEDVSEETITSQIRVGKSKDSDLIAEWVVTLDTDGTDGEVILTLDNTITAAIEEKKGYMDIKRIVDGEPVSAFDGFIITKITDPITE